MCLILYLYCWFCICIVQCICIVEDQIVKQLNNELLRQLNLQMQSCCNHICLVILASNWSSWWALGKSDQSDYSISGWRFICRCCNPICFHLIISTLRPSTPHPTWRLSIDPNPSIHFSTMVLYPSVDGFHAYCIMQRWPIRFQHFSQAIPFPNGLSMVQS